MSRARIAGRIELESRATRRRWVAAAACLTLVALGCGDPDLETYYGREQLPLTAASVNGTDVLAGMFSEAGHQVATRRALITSDMASVDTIVWTPDDYAAPTAEVCQWFDDWLAARPGRTLIYVGRSFDAAPVYWRKAAAMVPADQQSGYRQRALQAALFAQPFYQLEPLELQCEWFEIAKEPSRAASGLTGPWLAGVDATGAELELGWRLKPHDAESTLLASEGDTLVARLERLEWNGGQIVLVANGSFLLNVPLVNHEHRKLAGKLIAANKSDGRVVFLASGRGGPPIDPPATDNSLWRALGAWPLNAILLHFGVLGVIFCFARWPIFGRPKTPPAEVIADFGKHVEAVGALLRRTRDRAYAESKLPSGEDNPAATGRAVRK